MITTQTVTDRSTGRPTVVPCPGCGAGRVLRLTLVDAADAPSWMAEHTDPVLGPPDGHAAATIARGGVVAPTVSCTTCGYDGIYTFGAPR